MNAAGIVEKWRRRCLQALAREPSLATPEYINSLADDARAAVEAGDMDAFADAFHYLALSYAYAIAPHLGRQVHQRTAARNPRSKARQAALDLWQSMERQPGSAKEFGAEVKRRLKIECSAEQARRWFREFRQLAR